MRYTLALMRASSASKVKFVKASDQSLLVYFDPRDNGDVTRQPLHGKHLIKANESVRRLLLALSKRPMEGVCNLHPSYSSLLIKFDGRKWRHEELEKRLREYLDDSKGIRLPEQDLVEIPVCYGEEFGPDLKEVADLHGLTEQRVVELHTSTNYLVYFLGFVPGFAYLGELNGALVTARHATPRRKVPAGSVGIAGNQTGVYPCETPGGWRLLGRTPIAMFRPGQQDFSLLSIGDRVQFKAVSRDEFVGMSQSVRTHEHD